MACSRHSGANQGRVAWISPLNWDESPGPSRAADFSDLILPILRSSYQIDLFHDSFARYRDYPSFHYLGVAERERDWKYQLLFYQLEDLKLADFVRLRLATRPGIVLFHDFAFASDGPEPMLNSPWRDVLARFRGELADWPPRDREYQRSGPLGYREAGMAAVAIFCTERSHREYRSLVSERLVEQVPSYYLPPPKALPAQVRSLGLHKPLA